MDGNPLQLDISCDSMPGTVGTQSAKFTIECDGQNVNKQHFSAVGGTPANPPVVAGSTLSLKSPATPEMGSTLNFEVSSMTDPTNKQLRFNGKVNGHIVWRTHAMLQCQADGAGFLCSIQAEAPTNLLGRVLPAGDMEVCLQAGTVAGVATEELGCTDITRN